MEAERQGGDSTTLYPSFSSSVSLSVFLCVCLSLCIRESPSFSLFFLKLVNAPFKPRSAVQLSLNLKLVARIYVLVSWVMTHFWSIRHYLQLALSSLSYLLTSLLTYFLNYLLTHLRTYLESQLNSVQFNSILRLCLCPYLCRHLSNSLIVSLNHYLWAKIHNWMHKQQDNSYIRTHKHSPTLTDSKRAQALARGHSL